MRFNQQRQIGWRNVDMQWRQEDMVYLKHFICIIISIHRSIVNERIQQKDLNMYY